MATGSTIEEELRSAKTMPEVDRLVWKHVKAGHVPSYIASAYWKLVTIKENGHVLELLVAPDYFAIGTDTDPWRVRRGSPFLAQSIADKYDSILASRKLIDKIEEQASPKMKYVDVKTAPYKIPLNEIDTHAASVAANNLTNKAFDEASFKVGDGDQTTIGYSKSIVVGPNLDGRRVAIYGGRWTSAGGRVQPYSTIHGSDPAHVQPGDPSPHSDYSHTFVLVSRKAKLDGRKVDLRDDVFRSKDASVYGLVSDQGRFDPVFPNAGKNSIATFAVPGSSDVAKPDASGKKPTSSSNAGLPSASGYTGKQLAMAGGAVVGIVTLAWWTLS